MCQIVCRWFVFRVCAFPSVCYKINELKYIDSVLLLCMTGVVVFYHRTTKTETETAILISTASVLNTAKSLEIFMYMITVVWSGATE